MIQDENQAGLQIPLPRAFQTQMQSLLGTADFFCYEQSLLLPPVHGLRINSLKASDEKAIEIIRTALRNSDSSEEPLCTGDSRQGNGEGQLLRRVPWAEHGYYYNESLHPGQFPFHDVGLYYIQEPSAMSAVALLDPKPGEKVLDLCAAPGGKSTQIADRLSHQGILISNEPVQNRARILSQNIERMGVENCIVTNEMPDRLVPYFPEYFDRILVDAPCSGEGMFRKTPESRLEWHEGSPLQCQKRQLEILESAAPMLKSGGVLVYSTCTFNREENESVIEQFLQKHPEFELDGRPLPGLPGMEQGMLHLFPHQIEGEGHFLCRMQKKEAFQNKNWRVFEKAGTRRETGKGKKKQDVFPEMPDVLRVSPSSSRLLFSQSTLWQLLEGISYEQLRNLRVLRYGLALFEGKGRQLEPSHALALASSQNTVQRACALSWEEMIAFLAGETIQKTGPKGFTLMQYDGISLGWAKQSDGMMKNHYPKGLRRRSNLQMKEAMR